MISLRAIAKFNSLSKNSTEFLALFLAKMYFTFKGKDVGMLFYDGSEKDIRELFDQLVDEDYDINEFIEDYQILDTFYYHSYKRVYKILLEYGVDINFIEKTRNDTHLLTCLDDDHPEIAKRLIALKADVNLEINGVSLINNIQDFNISDRIELFNLLIDNGADTMKNYKYNCVVTGSKIECRNHNFIDAILTSNFILISYEFYKRSSSKNPQFDHYLNEYNKVIREKDQFSLKRSVKNLTPKISSFFRYLFMMVFCFIISFRNEIFIKKRWFPLTIVYYAIANLNETYDTMMFAEGVTNRLREIRDGGW